MGSIDADTDRGDERAARRRRWQTIIPVRLVIDAEETEGVGVARRGRGAFSVVVGTETGKGSSGGPESRDKSACVCGIVRILVPQQGNIVTVSTAWVLGPAGPVRSDHLARDNRLAK